MDWAVDPAHQERLAGRSSIAPLRRQIERRSGGGSDHCEGISQCLDRIVVAVGQGTRLGGEFLGGDQHRLGADDIHEVLLGGHVILRERRQDGVGIGASGFFDPADFSSFLAILYEALGACRGHTALD